MTPTPVACIGWLALDNDGGPCPVHGPVHGCQWPGGHPGDHRCPCGHTRRKPPRGKAA